MNPTLTQAASLPNIPWQNRPGNCSAPVWRYTENPIISRNPIPDVARIFNSAVIPYQGAYVGVFRGEQHSVYLLRQKPRRNPLGVRTG